MIQFQIRREVEIGEILSLPIFPDLDEASLDAVAEAIREFLTSR